MRNEFPIFQAEPHLIYLDTAATAHKPRIVIDALKKAYDAEYATVHRAIYRSAMQATEKYHETRVFAAQFLNANHAEEIVFTKGTTDGINLVAQSYGKTFLKRGDEILITEMEHHSNLVPWQMAAKQTGATLRFIPMKTQGVLEWEGTITPQTKIVSLAHISNVTGTIHPIREIIQEAHRMGAVVLIDGAQAAPHIKIDVQALDCDFYVFSGHKCYGPNGVGILYGRKSLLESMPPIQGGGDMIEQVELDHSTYQKPPLRFEAGTPNIASVIALKDALQFVESVRDSEAPLIAFATQQMQQIEGLKILGTAPQKGPIISFYVEGVHPLDIATFLDLKHIAIRSGHLCAQPLLKRFGLQSVARVSFGIYNTLEEVDLFLTHLRKTLRQLQ